jgi:hypothetical protein
VDVKASNGVAATARRRRHRIWKLMAISPVLAINYEDAAGGVL